eukprot:2930967-Lingulodinium_polyedra.AAC.1
MWKRRKQKRLTAAMKQLTTAMRHVKEEQSPRGDQEQGSEQSERLMDVIFWLFAPRIRLFNVCRAKTS